MHVFAEFAADEGIDALNQIPTLLKVLPELCLAVDADWDRYDRLVDLDLAYSPRPRRATEAFNEFIAFKSILDPGSVANYRHAKRVFLKWVSAHIGPNAYLSDIDVKKAREWSKAVSAMAIAPQGKNHLEGMIRTFFNYCLKQIWIDTTPFSDRFDPHRPFPGHAKRRCWSHAETLLLLKQCILYRPDLAAILATMVILGVPMHIAIQLRYQDFRWLDGMLVVPSAVTRKRTEWYILLPRTFREWFRNAPEWGHLCDLDRSGLRWALLILRQEAGLKSAWKMETITAISHLVASGVDLQDALAYRGLAGAGDPGRYFDPHVSTDAGVRYLNSVPPCDWRPILPYARSTSKLSSRPWHKVMHALITPEGWQAYHAQAFP